PAGWEMPRPFSECSVALVAGPFAPGKRPVVQPLDTLGALSLPKRRRPYPRMHGSTSAGSMQLTFISLCVVAGRSVERVGPSAPGASWGQAAQLRLHKSGRG